MKKIATTLVSSAMVAAAACGGGGGTVIESQDVTVIVDAADAVTAIEEVLTGAGTCGAQACLGPGSATGLERLPALWPGDAPAVRQEYSFTSSRGNVGQFTPPDVLAAQDLQLAGVTVEEMVLEVELNELRFALPESTLEISFLGAPVTVPAAWKAAGRVPAIGAGQTGMRIVALADSTEADLLGFLSDPDGPGFSFRLRATPTFDTDRDPERPQGQARLRMGVRLGLSLR
jgi:hypothetical protein